MYKTKIKAIALFSSVLVAVSSVSTSAVSALTSSPPGDSNASFALKPGDLTSDELKTAALDDDDLPETISPSEAKLSGHVNRLYEQEQDLNTVIFQNRAGDNTAYIYSYPVKYVDENGEVKDKKKRPHRRPRKRICIHVRQQRHQSAFPR